MIIHHVIHAIISIYYANKYAKRKGYITLSYRKAIKRALTR